jgi:alkaline phosphatase D
MPPDPIEVSWQVSEDEGMTRVVGTGVARAEAAWAHSVHVEVEGLRPDRWYWYRFRVDDEWSLIGRSRTLPAPDFLPGELRFAFASCQKYEMGYYTAHEHMAREDLDLVVFLGDYIYEKDDSSKGVRPHGLKTVQTLEDYRLRYAVYKADPALQAAHAAAPWIVTWDDHEVDNDYAGAVPGNPQKVPVESFLARRAAAYRAYYEHMPLRRSARPAGPDMTLYRTLDFGRLARFCVLDTRQYRSDQPAGPRDQPVSLAQEDPSRTMLGEVQRLWLADELSTSPAAWNVLAQQVLMARVDFDPAPEFVVDVDKWAGYEHERRWLLRYLRDERISNPVVLTGDIHSNWAIELTEDSLETGGDPVAVEFVGTSISSGGNGGEDPEVVAALRAGNPSVKFHNDRRGYVRCVVTPDAWRTDFQTVPYIDRRGAPLVTAASFMVENGDAHLHRIRAPQAPAD